MITSSMGHLLVWIIRKIGTHTLLVILVLGMIYGSIAAGMQSLVRGLQDSPIVTITLIAVLTGWLLGRSRSSGRLASLLATLLGLAILLVNVGKLSGKLVALGVAISQLLGDALRWQRGAPPPNPGLVLLLLQNIGWNIAELIRRVGQWVVAMAGGALGYEAAATAMAWGLLLWGTAAWAGWAVRRRANPLAGVLPAGVLFAGSLSFARAPSMWLIPLLTGTFLLLTWVTFFQQEQRWQTIGTDYAEDIRFDVAVWSIVATIGLVSLSLLVSLISPHKIFEFIQRLAQDRSGTTTQIGNSLGLQMQPPPTPKSPPRSGTGNLPRDHLLGSGPELSSEMVMIVTVNLPHFTATSDGEQPRPVFYWRELTYDIYNGHGWATSLTNSTEYKADELASPPSIPGHKPLWQQIQRLSDQGNALFAAGTLITVDQDFYVTRRITPESDWYTSDIFGATLNGKPKKTSYTVESVFPYVGQVQLRLAGTDYPQWIRDRYLQLPESIPQRVLDLAHTLTTNASTPYERAYALESYLRKFPYTLDVPEPPPDREVADYFLFDLQKGYCDYYASAMVVMARVIGIPARLAIGYASGSYDGQYERFGQGRYIVTEADAHSWVEIYFPGIGWVEFEPTGGRPPLERPEDVPLVDVSEAGGNAPAKPLFFWPIWLRWLGRAGLAAAALAYLLSAWAVIDLWRLRRLDGSTALKTLYRRLYRHGKGLGTPIYPGDTPHEFSVSLAGQIASLEGKKRRWEALTPAAQEARQLVDLYARGLYSPKPTDASAQAQAIDIWRHLRSRLGMARLLGIIRNANRKIVSRFSSMTGNSSAAPR